MRKMNFSGLTNREHFGAGVRAFLGSAGNEKHRLQEKSCAVKQSRVSVPEDGSTPIEFIETGVSTCSEFSLFQSLALAAWIGLVSTLLLIASTGSAVAAMVYSTGFETSEGYKTNSDLVGQKGWMGLGSGGNGVVSGFFPGKGQQAYIGFQPPVTNDSSLFIFQPINKTIPQMQCSVTMAIIDSSNTNWDDFYWTVYNQQGKELFALDFDNFYLKLYYQIGTNDRTWSGLTFSNAIAYKVNVMLDFSNNSWSATLGNSLVATNQPISTNGVSLNFGDFDAAWVIFDPSAPGDNLMVFDDYQISATVAPPQLQLLGLVNGSPTLRVTGLADNTFALEASTNLLNWLPLKTNITTGGSYDYVDSATAGLARRYYRSRWVP